jgi:ribosome-binding protein aMBF1 (putative translation factor)
MPTKKTNSFDDYVREVEAELTPEQRAVLDTFRDHYGVANQLLRLRRDRGVSQAELARRTGIAQAEISKIERGLIEPRTGTLAKLARGLDARVALLAG